MKKPSKIIFLVSTLIIGRILFDLTSCTHDDQLIEQATTYSATDLVSLKTSTAPTIDGTIDAAWADATKMEFTAVVPEPGNNLFAGYIGDNYKTTIRSMYDDKNIYFLVEYPDPSKGVNSSPWYFDAAAKLWKQEGTSNSYDANGVLIRKGFGEDKISFLWDIDGSNPKFKSQTCYASCHVFVPYMDYSKDPAVMTSNAGRGNHYTNGTNEKIDMWWGHQNRGLAFNNIDDNYQDWAGGPQVTSLVGGSGNGRHFDDLVVNGASTTWPFAPTYTSDATQGSISNRQSLKLDGDGKAVNVPLWIIPGGTNIDRIVEADTKDGGKARKVTGVSSAGVLTYDGGTIDPSTDAQYQRAGTNAQANLGTKAIPGNILLPVKNGRADIPGTAVHNGNGWVWEFKRALKTGDVLKQDVDFSSLGDQPFGFAVWDNNNNQHAIKTNLTLKFKK